jgi:hypothetical protein
MFDIDKVASELVPIFKKMFRGKIAISISGSIGKKIMDARSDVDFRVFYEEWIDDKEEIDRLHCELNNKREEFRMQGIKVDDYWPRTISEVDSVIDTWFLGEGKPLNVVWTVWGYHPLTDFANQYVIDDEHNIIGGWLERLSNYPPKLKQKTIDRCLCSIKYWRNDYHYESKVIRRDIVFVNGLTTKLMHEIIELLYALNEKYYVGDGNNLKFMEGFELLPENFFDRVEKILVPGNNVDMFKKQREDLCSLIDDVVSLA